MADIIDVARYILDSYKSTTGIKLHKLLFYCQLKHYLRYHELLIKEANFIIKDNGVICTTLYDKITELVSGNDNRISKKEILSIEETLKYYARLTIHELTLLNKKEIPASSLISFPDTAYLYGLSRSSDNASN